MVPLLDFISILWFSESLISSLANSIIHGQCEMLGCRTCKLHSLDNIHDHPNMLLWARHDNHINLIFLPQQVQAPFKKVAHQTLPNPKKPLFRRILLALL